MIASCLVRGACVHAHAHALTCAQTTRSERRPRRWQARTQAGLRPPWSQQARSTAPRSKSGTSTVPSIVKPLFYAASNSSAMALVGTTRSGLRSGRASERRACKRAGSSPGSGSTSGCLVSAHTRRASGLRSGRRLGVRDRRGERCHQRQVGAGLPRPHRRACNRAHKSRFQGT